MDEASAGDCGRFLERMESWLCRLWVMAVFMLMNTGEEGARALRGIFGSSPSTMGRLRLRIGDGACVGSGGGISGWISGRSQVSVDGRGASDGA